MSVSHHKRDDCAEGCRSLSADDLERAATAINHHIRARFELSANAWSARADLLDRIEASFKARAACIASANNSNVDADLG